MRRRAGKFIALCLAAACVAIGGALWGLRERIAEEWWLRKLEAAEKKEEREEAMRRLGEMHSLRAIPRLLRRVEAGRPLHIEQERSTIAYPCYVPDMPVSRRVRFHEGDDGADRELMAALAAIVTSRGEESLGFLLAALNDERVPVQRRAVELLGLLGPGGERAIPALAAMLDSILEPELEADIVDTLARIGAPPPPAVRDFLVRRGWKR